MYAVVGSRAVKVALERRLEEERQRSDTTATIMGWPGGQWIVALVGLAVDRRTASTWSAGPGPRSSASTSTGEGQGGEAGQAYIWFGKAGYIGQGRRLPGHRRPVRLRRRHPRAEEGRRPRRRAAQGARAAVRPGPARPDRASASAATGSSASPGPGTCPAERGHGHPVEQVRAWRARATSTWWWSGSGPGGELAARKLAEAGLARGRRRAPPGGRRVPVLRVHARRS